MLSKLCFINFCLRSQISAARCVATATMYMYILYDIYTDNGYSIRANNVDLIYYIFARNVKNKKNAVSSTQSDYCEYR